MGVSVDFPWWWWDELEDMVTHKTNNTQNGVTINLQNNGNLSFLSYLNNDRGVFVDGFRKVMFRT